MGQEQTECTDHLDSLELISPGLFWFEFYITIPVMWLHHRETAPLNTNVMTLTLLTLLMIYVVLQPFLIEYAFTHGWACIAYLQHCVLFSPAPLKHVGVNHRATMLPVTLTFIILTVMSCKTQTLYSLQLESRGCIWHWRERYCLSRGCSSLPSLDSTIFTAIWMSLSALKKEIRCQKIYKYNSMDHRFKWKHKVIVDLT